MDEKIAGIRRQSVGLRKRFLERHNGECAVCGFHAGRILRLHHIHPVAKGGTNDNWNLILLCPNCHDSIHEMARRSRGPNGVSESEKQRSWEMFNDYRKSLHNSYAPDEVDRIVDLAQRLNQ